MINKIHKIIKRDGFFGLIKLISNRFFSKKMMIHIILSPLSFTITGLIFIISPWLRIRLIMLFSNRVGHFAWNTEFWLCVIDKFKNDKNIKYINFFYTIPGHPVANKQLYYMWKRAITILPFPYIVSEVHFFLQKISKWYRNRSE